MGLDSRQALGLIRLLCGFHFKMITLYIVLHKIPYSSISNVTGYRLDDRSLIPDIFTTSRTALGLIRPPYFQWSLAERLSTEKQENDALHFEVYIFRTSHDRFLVFMTEC
jgi:hypothetical protein